MFIIENITIILHCIVAGVHAIVHRDFNSMSMSLFLPNSSYTCMYNVGIHAYIVFSLGEGVLCRPTVPAKGSR